MPNITKPSGLNNIWAEGGTKIDPGSSKYNIGWVVQLPPYEYQNYIDNRQDRAIAHLNQHGVPEWDGVTEYQGLLSYTQGSDGIIYKCIQTNVNKDPSNALNSAFWARAFEDFGSVAVVQAALAAHITDYQTLANLGNPAAARVNLSVYSKTEVDTFFATKNGNAGQVFAVATATQPAHAVRLDQVASLIVQATESVQGTARIATNAETEAGTLDTRIVTPLKAATVYLKKSGNLAGLSNPATARANLGLGSASVQDSTAFLQTSNNLTDILDSAVARAALGITSTATRPEAYFLRSANNLSDLASVSSSRANLGLGTSAVRDVGIVAGTVAAGDDSRIVNAVPNTRQVVAGNGLTGGGSLSGNIAVTLGTPTTLTGTSTNTVTATSHSHAIDTTALFTDKSLTPNGYINLGGLIIQWGIVPKTTSNGQLVNVTFPKPFGSQVFVAGPLSTAGIIFGNGTSDEGIGVQGSPSLTGFTMYSAWAGGTLNTISWIAIGI